MWRVYLLMFIVVFVVSLITVNGNTHIPPRHKDDGLFGDFDDEEINDSLWNKDRRDYDED